jgi:hypothetical protein
MPVRRPITLAHRRVIRRRRQFAAAGLLLISALVVVTGFRLAAALTSSPVATRPATSRIGASAPASALATAPARATGQYTRAPGGSARQGSGKLVTYRVEVETGTSQSAPAFAAAVDATLANPASWAGQGRWSLQRITGQNADLVIRLATSATVAKVCEAAGLQDAAYSSCRVGQFVMINLDRWLTAVPEYHGDVALYRNYVINHEVGHGLGLGHQACPGPGRPAPVMQQQTLGLNGCLPNGWPYVAGVLVSGPAVS